MKPKETLFQFTKDINKVCWVENNIWNWSDFVMFFTSLKNISLCKSPRIMIYQIQFSLNLQFLELERTWTKGLK